MAKVALATTQVEEFESLESLEHYVKEHSPLSFDDKVDLLESKKIIIDGEDDASITIEILAEFAPTEEGQTLNESATSEPKTGDQPGTEQ